MALRALLLPLAVLLVAAPAAAQPDSTRTVVIYHEEAPAERPPNRGWLGSGPGTSSGGLGFAGHLTLTRNGHVLSLRSAASFSLLGELVCAVWGPEPECSVSVVDGGVLYGRALVDTPKAFVSVGVGAGVVDAVGRDRPVSWAVPIEVQARRSVTPWLGLGVYGFGSVNGTRPFGGVAFSVQVGEMR